MTDEERQKARDRRRGLKLAAALRDGEAIVNLRDSAADEIERLHRMVQFQAQRYIGAYGNVAKMIRMAEEQIK